MMLNLTPDEIRFLDMLLAEERVRASHLDGSDDGPARDLHIKIRDPRGAHIKLSDLNASEYDDLIVETMDQRNNALWLLTQIRDLNEEAHRDNWSALGIYSGIRALLKKEGGAA